MDNIERRLFNNLQKPPLELEGRENVMGFLLVYATPVLMIVSAWLGRTTQYPNTFTLMPLGVVYVLLPVIQWAWSRPARMVPEKSWESTPWQLYDRALPVLSLAAQLVMLYVATDWWSSASLNSWGRLTLVFSTGVFSSIFAVNIGHELIHRRGKLDPFLGGVLLSTVGFGTFKVVHLQIHHPHMGTPLDFATARRDQGLYDFLWRNLSDNFAEAVRCERARLSEAGKSWWHSELLVWSLFSVLWCVLAWMFWGWMGSLFFVLQSLIAIMKLDSINYLQHYGLTRRVSDNGQFELVSAHHSWSDDRLLYNLFLLNLFRHSDHHMNPLRPYPLLREFADTPRYPYNYSVMFLLSLVPQAFRAVVHPCLDEYHQTRA